MNCGTEMCCRAHSNVNCHMNQAFCVTHVTNHDKCTDIATSLIIALQAFVFSAYCYPIGQLVTNNDN
jgi:hypothetical protein